MRLRDRLTKDLATAGYNPLWDNDAQRWVIHPRDGSTATDDVVIDIGLEELERYLIEASESAASVFPDADPIEASYRLFLANLDEIVHNDLPNGGSILLVDDRLRPTPVPNGTPKPNLNPLKEQASAYYWSKDPGV